MNKAVLLIASLFLVVACAPQNFQEQTVHPTDSSQIVGGDKVESSSNIGRSTVGIYESKIGYICSGTLIAKNLILTAAHCVDPKAKDLVVIFAPEMKKAGKEQIRRVTGQVVHDGYTGEVQSKDTNDIAVLRFEGEAPAGYQVAPMLFDSGYLNNNVRTIVAGYGLNWTILLSKGAGTLRTAKLSIEDVNFSRTEVMLGQSVRRGICSGDSGGPAYLELNGRLHVWGVASRGDSLPGLLTPKCMLFSVFTRVDAHQDFIAKAVAELRGN